jgi:hypothetical protein
MILLPAVGKFVDEVHVDGLELARTQIVHGRHYTFWCYF